MANGPMDRVRAICVGLPEAYEELTWGAATFRVRKKIFAIVSDEAGVLRASLKALREDQEAMLAQGTPFYLPPYVGAKGWIGVVLSDGAVDWQEVDELIRESYRLVAPRRLAAEIA